VDLRYFEIHDLLCDALIAVEAGDARAAATTLRKALAWAEAEWLATPAGLTEVGPSAAAPAGPGGPDDGDDD
jgi:hypothetical protein